MNNKNERHLPLCLGDYPFALDGKVLEYIGFAAAGFQNYLEITERPERGKDYDFLVNRFVLACVMWSQSRNSVYDNTANGYTCVTNMLEACCGKLEEQAEEHKDD